MADEGIRKRTGDRLVGRFPHGVRERVPRVDPPRWLGAFVRLPWRRLAVVVGGVVGLVAQMLLLHMAYELWDLSVDLMELWAELARKHLEITLSR